MKPESPKSDSPERSCNTHLVRVQKDLSGGSKVRKYQDLIVGRPGLYSLFKYELINLFCQGLPGVLGLVMRRALYPRLLKKCGKNVVFGRNVVLRSPSYIEIGDDVIVDDNCLLDAKGFGDSGIVIESGTFIGRNSILSCKNGRIYLGKNVNIGFNCEIYSGSMVTLEDDCMMAAYSYLVGGDHNAENLHEAVNKQGGTSYGILMQQGSWVGAGVKVLDGITIGKHAIVGAGAVVTRDIDAYMVAAGIPAKVIKKRKIDPAFNDAE
jgi:acetyltransferase-like isoleucine patch superfamily enzyme